MVSENPFLVVLPFWQGDEHLAALNLEWAISLDKSVPYDCILVCPFDCDRARIEELADLYFNSVQWHGIDPSPVKGWPHGKNWAWQHTARFIYEKYPDKSWLWWEPDSTPVRKGWLFALGAICERRSGTFDASHFKALGHIDSVAIYPSRILEVSTEAMLCRAAPFEQVAGRSFIDSSRSSQLLSCIWDINGMSPSFKTRKDVDKLVPKESVLFHRCKDGSLIEVLSESRLKRAVKGFFSCPVKAQQETKDATCIISLGRYGDVINILPVAHYLSREKSVSIMVSEKFVDVLQGITYATAKPWSGDFTDVQNAITEARKEYSDIIVGQVNGRGINITCECDSFSAESWRQLGHLDKWNDLPLVFDNRNVKRERRLWSQYKRDGSRKTVLVNFSGHSSPYPHPLREEIVGRWNKVFEIIDLSTVKAQRIYDLLGMFDRADLLVTIDTATTHLAYGSSIPVINLVTDTPTLWHGARPRGNSILALRYKESWLRRNEIHTAIERISFESICPLIAHVFSDYPTRDQESLRRMRMAGRTWSLEYRNGRWLHLGILDSDLPRLFKDKDRHLPYLKDLITTGLDEAETIILTNADICIAPGATRRILDQLHHTPVFYCHRRDFEKLNRPLAMAELPMGRRYVGFDLFGISRSWWQKHGNEMPDMVLGAEGFDAVLGNLMESSLGKSCCFVDDMCYHEKRINESSYWEREGNRYTLPSQRYNIDLAKKYFNTKSVDYRKFGIK